MFFSCGSDALFASGEGFSRVLCARRIPATLPCWRGVAACSASLLLGRLVAGVQGRFSVTGAIGSSCWAVCLLFGDFFQHGDFQVVKPRLQAGFDVKGSFDGRFEVTGEQLGKGFAIGQIAFGAAMFEPVRAD